MQAARRDCGAHLDKVEAACQKLLECPATAALRQGLLEKFPDETHGLGRVFECNGFLMGAGFVHMGNQRTLDGYLASGSCSLLGGETCEHADGIDNDCNGEIDEAACQPEGNDDLICSCPPGTLAGNRLVPTCRSSCC